jgi:basic membrane protein A
VRPRPLAALTTLAPLAAALLALLAAGCGGDDDSASGTTTGTTAAARTTRTDRPALRVGLVADDANLESPALTALAEQGLVRAAQRVGVEGRVVHADGPAELERGLSDLAGEGFDLVLAAGNASGPVDRVAASFPDTMFALVGVEDAEGARRPANVRGLRFEEQEAGYLVGYLAGLVVREQSRARQTIGAVAGRRTRTVDRYVAGYLAGARRAYPGVRTVTGYTGGFRDPASCKQAALAQITRGATVVFDVAGHCGQGALDAARERNIWAIGLDADQSRLGGFILTSALRNADVAVFETVRALRDGRFGGGEDIVFDVASGGVGVGPTSAEVPPDIVAKLQALQDDVAAGRVTVPGA